VAVEGLWELPEDGPELSGSGERLERLEEAVDARRRVAQPPDVGQVAARLDGEQEVFGRLLDPGGDCRARGEPVEGRVHLDRVEESRVVLEPAACRHLL